MTRPLPSENPDLFPPPTNLSWPPGRKRKKKRKEGERKVSPWATTIFLLMALLEGTGEKKEKKKRPPPILFALVGPHGGKKRKGEGEGGLFVAENTGVRRHDHDARKKRGEGSKTSPGSNGGTLEGEGKKENRTWKHADASRPRRGERGGKGRGERLFLARPFSPSYSFFSGPARE